MGAEAHKHEWVRIDDSLPQEVCMCGYIKIDELHIGKNSITLSPSATDVVRWSASEVGPSVGDIGMNVTTGRPQFNISGTGSVAAGVQGDHTGAAWGLANYGSGVDGTLTLVANTTLTSRENVQHITTLDLAGFILNNTTGDRGLVLFISGSIKGGGTIQGRRNSFDGFAGSNSSSGGFGGNTAISGGFCHVMVNTLESGAYTFSSRSSAGGNGGNGLTPTTTANGTNGNNGSDSVIISGRIKDSAGFAGGGGGGQSDGTAGIAGVGGGGYPSRAFKDIVKFICPGGEGVGENDFYRRTWRGANGGRGGRGGANNGGTQAAGGGGGGAGTSYVSDLANGGNGGAGGAGLAGTSGTGGGGGGGGGTSSVSFCMVGFNNATSLNVSAIGGTGGDGGNGDVANAGRGGGGAGGAGGIAIYIGASGDPRTVSAAGGAGGAAGSGTGNGGSAGSSGVSGVDYDLTR